MLNGHIVFSYIRPNGRSLSIAFSFRMGSNDYCTASAEQGLSYNYSRFRERNYVPPRFNCILYSILRELARARLTSSTCNLLGYSINRT